MDDAKSDKNRRGGGVRLPALLLALICALGWAVAAPHEAVAADGTWNLYYLTENAGLEQVPGEFTRLGLSDGSMVCAAGADGRVLSVSRTSPYKPVSSSAGCVAIDETDAHGDPGAIPMHSDTWGFSEIFRASPQSYLNLSIDEGGRLWVISYSTADSNTGAPTWAYRDIEFSAGIARQYVGEVSVLLLGRPRAQTAGTVINQSPTAGAPVSDLTIPALAVGGGLAAVGFGLSRRRRA